MESLWSKSVSFKRRAALEGDIKVNTAVIGGGIAGLLTAYRLREKGIDAVVLEAREICGGQTKNTTAKITSQHGILYSKIETGYGRAAAKHYAAVNQKAISDYERIISEKNISCHFERKKAVLYTLHDKEKLFKERDAARQAGIDCGVTDKTELPFPVKAALVFENQAQFNPLEFLLPISQELRIYEDTPVIKIVGNRIITDRGTVTARNIVFACHYPFVNFPGLYFLRMSQERSYVVSTEWNGNLEGMYIDAGNGLSFRTYENQLLIGGGAHRTGEAPENDPFEMLVKKGKMLFPEFNETARWSAQDCITLDGIPYIGEFSCAFKNVYVATGFNKWGMTSSMAAASIISDKICGKGDHRYWVFSPSRFSPIAGAKNLCTNTKETIKGFAKRLETADITAEGVRNGEARVVRYNGKKAGAYRDENGKLYVVTLKCPHLKCELNWNETTKTWDCPCHGSRYDYKGNLLDNPAQHQSILLN